MSASLVDAFTTSLSCFNVLFGGSLAIETLRAVRGLGGIVVREVSDLSRRSCRLHFEFGFAARSTHNCLTLRLIVTFGRIFRHPVAFLRSD
jgi:hypothetical protein